MRKEVIVAILLGLSLGLIVSYGVYRARKSLQTSDTSSQQTDNGASPNPSASPHTSLVLVSPDDESIQTTKDVKVTGTTLPNALVVIFVNDKENITNADSSGNFSIETELQPNANVITVRSIDEDGNTAEEKRTVIFTNVSLDEVPTASSSALSATPSASLVKSVKSRQSNTPSPSPSASDTTSP